MVPVNPANLERGTTVFVREYKNKGTGQEPRVHYREAKVHEAKPKVIFVKYKDSKDDVAYRVRPSEVFLNDEITRVAPVKAVPTLIEAIKDAHKETKGTLVPVRPVPDDTLFGDGETGMHKIKQAAVDVSDFEAWLEMGRGFARIPERIRMLAQKKESLALEIQSIEQEMEQLSAQYAQMKELLANGFLNGMP